MLLDLNHIVRLAMPACRHDLDLAALEMSTADVQQTPLMEILLGGSLLILVALSAGIGRSPQTPVGPALDAADSRRAPSRSSRHGWWPQSHWPSAASMHRRLT